MMVIKQCDMDPPQPINKCRRISDGEIGYIVWTHREKQMYTVVYSQSGVVKLESIFDIENVPDEIPSVARKPKRDLF